MEQNKTQYIVSEYLQSLKESDDGKTPEQVNALETVLQLLQDNFPACNLSDPDNFKKFSHYPANLSSIITAGAEALDLKTHRENYAAAKTDPKFESFMEVVASKGYFNGTEEGTIEYLQREAKVVSKFQQKKKDEINNNAVSKEGSEEEAEKMKNEGNKAINAKKYEEAKDFYTQALDLSGDGPNSHVYYSNRAAAFCHMNKYQEAVEDCLLSLQLSPDYVKAYSRLGLSYFFLEQYEESIEAYERACELEPDNKASKDSLTKVKEKLRKVQQKNLSKNQGGAPGGNMDLGSMMNNLGGQQGLAGLMNNPQMRAMADQMMKDPAMMQKAMSMLGGAGGNGGMPDMSKLAGLMGGMNGDAPSSSSGKN